MFVDLNIGYKKSFNPVPFLKKKKSLESWPLSVFNIIFLMDDDMLLFYDSDSKFVQ